MIDHSAKDLVVRIGDYKNDQGHTDVGGKYSFGTYGSALSIMLRGYFPDNEGGSGINKFYYRVKSCTSSQLLKSCGHKIFQRP